MTKQEENNFKKLIKEAVLEVLKSEEAKKAIVAAMKSDEGQEVLVKSFVQGYTDVVEPMLDDILHEIKTLKIELRYIKDNYGTRIAHLERKIGVVV